VATNIGHPAGQPAESEVFDTSCSHHVRERGDEPDDPKQALDEAHQQVKKIFEKWRAKGLVAGGSSDRG